MMTSGLTNIETYLIIGLSTDEKPAVDVPGSTFIETDTGKTFAWTGAGAWVSRAPILGLSTDIKPVVGIFPGSVFIEVDTGQIAVFNLAGLWIKPLYL